MMFEKVQALWEDLIEAEEKKKNVEHLTNGVANVL